MQDLGPWLGDRSVRTAVSDVIVRAVGYPTPEKLDGVLRRYADDRTRRLVGLDRDGVLVGVLGFEVHGPGRATIWHIAVRPEARGQGIGRALVRWLVETADMSEITADTDRNAVGFYRRLGFTVTSLGELWPGTERFRCQLRTADPPTPGAHSATSG